MLWLLLAAGAETIFNPKEPDFRAAIEAKQQKGEDLDIALPISGNKDATDFMRIGSFYKIKGSGKVWIEKRYNASAGAFANQTAKVLQAVDCSAHTYGIIAYTFYNPDGSIGKSTDNGSSAPEVINIIPGTLGEALLYAACNTVD